MNTKGEGEGYEELQATHLQQYSQLQAILSCTKLLAMYATCNVVLVVYGMMETG